MTTDPRFRIERVVSHPLRATLPVVQRTSQGEHPSVDIVVVEVFTADGVVGLGECLARKGAAAYARFIDDIVAPRIIGQDARDRRGIWALMRSALTGRAGGQIIECMAGIDIALWDIVGKALEQPIYRLLGGMGTRAIPAYASSINWFADELVEKEVEAALRAGFREIKVKIAHPVAEAIARARFVRQQVGDAVALYADANWAFDLPDAQRVGRALSDLDFGFFEEPLRPEDRAGYLRLAESVPIRLAAGESDFVASEAAQMLVDRSIGVIQPDVARSGGITETWRIAELAAVFQTAYAPHVGWSGAICEAASLHLAAAAQATRTFEKMVFSNPLREELCEGIPPMTDGHVRPPEGPGLGIELDRTALKRMRLS
ncbi:MAG: mandelate racemase/muconate lactonizing enzyme family protein [Dehalococcoidia bacterium]